MFVFALNVSANKIVNCLSWP